METNTQFTKAHYHQRAQQNYTTPKEQPVAMWWHQTRWKQIHNSSQPKSRIPPAVPIDIVTAPARQS